MRAPILTTALAAAMFAVLLTAGNAGAAEPAQFAVNCGAPQIELGGEPGDNNPAVAVSISYRAKDHDKWRIVRTLRNGTVVSRAEQYAIVDLSDDHMTKWLGSLYDNRSLMTVGEIRIEGDQIVYREQLFARATNNVLIMDSRAVCTQLPRPAPATPMAKAPPTSRFFDRPYKMVQPRVMTWPPPLLPAPAPKGDPLPRKRDSIPIYLTNAGAAARIDVIIGGQPLRMLLDTGATHCQIPRTVAEQIVRDGNGAWQPAKYFRLADGSFRSSPMILIREVRIGNHMVRDVETSIVDSDMALMAFPVLNGIAPFTIDTRLGELIFHPEN